MAAPQGVRSPRYNFRGPGSFSGKPQGKGDDLESLLARITELRGKGFNYGTPTDAERQRAQENEMRDQVAMDGGKPAKAAPAYQGLRNEMGANTFAGPEKPSQQKFGANVTVPGVGAAFGAPSTPSGITQYPSAPFGANASVPGTQTGGQATLPSQFTGVGAVGASPAAPGMAASNPYSNAPVQNQFNTNTGPNVGGAAFGGAQGAPGGGMGIGDFRGSVNAGTAMPFYNPNAQLNPGGLPRGISGSGIVGAGGLAGPLPGTGSGLGGLVGGLADGVGGIVRGAGNRMRSNVGKFGDRIQDILNGDFF